MKIKKQRRAQLNRAFKELKNKESKPMDYVCEFVNESLAPYKVMERGKHLMDVPPEGKSRLEMFLSSVSWSRWSKVVIGRDGEIKSLTENTGWAPPWKKSDDLYLLEIFNEHGSSGGENIRLGDTNPILHKATPFLLVPKGIPQLVPLCLDDPLIKYSKLHWKLIEKKAQLAESGYYKKIVEVVCEKTLRPQAELIAIYTRRAAINSEAFESDQKRRLSSALGLDDSALRGQE